MRKLATSFKLTKETIRQMDMLIEHPPPLLVDGINGRARNRTEVIEILVRNAYSLIPDEAKVKATKQTSRPIDSTQESHSDQSAK